ncbi:winged helix-turn-helix domain-containing protein [Streptomyces sp. NBC_00243]|uniref:AfsR/SARP family transcriptional regulator n=1 Tax=Streptomyces sp. NBC_00243 TaxID=2975688 RepID=UPI002DDAC878|nr:BTAD domain-containing putative transcriptional regulator [Streptomyces sp. NBC_00243]WRZ21106.1 winged helix-turn-helix domain-containing protein [Streptomyces sp. NBC_00243]
MEQRIDFGVLGAVVAERGGGSLALKGPRHRAVLARLIVARRRVVSVARLVEDLWEEPPPGAVGAVQTFVGALRRALEPERPPRAPARLLVTEGPGYALRVSPDAVDAWRFEAVVGGAGELPAEEALEGLEEALGWWRGPAYAEFAHERWARGERSRLSELRLQAVERRAAAQLALGRAAEAVPDLDVHAAGHPWREDAWCLLALALYRAGRQTDALAVVRRARVALADQLGLDPGPALRRLEADILVQAPGLEVGGFSPPPPLPIPVTWGLRPQTPAPQTPEGLTPSARPAFEDEAVQAERGSGGGAPRKQGTGRGGGGEETPTPAPDAAAQIWTRATAAYDRAAGAGPRARLESAVGLMRSLAVTGGGGLEAAREQRMAAVDAAEESGDSELTARVIGAYDVPAIWTRVDDPELAERLVAAAERTLAALSHAPAYDAARCRLLATIALEMRGTRSPRGPEAAREAEETARRLDDPALLAFALNGTFMQSFTRAGLAPRRDEIGAELVTLSARHGLITFEVLGHLIRLQARSALADFATADEHAAAADRLAERHELPLVGVFTEWYGALRTAASGQRQAEAEAAYRAAAARLDGAGMPGLERGLLPLASLCLRLAHRAPATATGVDLRADWGPYRPWAEPLALLETGRRTEAGAALCALPEPPRDLLYEGLSCLEAAAALRLRDPLVLRRTYARLLPAADELAGAGSGLISLGPVKQWLAEIETALRSLGAAQVPESMRWKSS